MRPAALAAALGLTLLVGVACPEPSYPGSQFMTFDFTAAVPGTGDCSLAELPTEDFTFTGTFSWNEDGTTFFTLGEVDHDATFDGQVAAYEASARRLFEACACTETTVVEEMRVAVLSSDQWRPAEGCPPDALDGGLGGTPPGRPGSGYIDAPHACGELTDDVVPGEGCTCAACSVRYTVEGVRQ